MTSGQSQPPYDHHLMIRRPLVLASVPLFALLVGCSQAKDAASDAASSAVSQVRNTAQAEVMGRICAPLEDGQVSAQDKLVLSGLVATAKAAGVSAEVTDPLEQIAESGDQPPAESIAALRTACE